MLTLAVATFSEVLEQRHKIKQLNLVTAGIQSGAVYRPLILTSNYDFLYASITGISSGILWPTLEGSVYTKWCGGSGRSARCSHIGSAFESQFILHVEPREYDCMQYIIWRVDSGFGEIKKKRYFLDNLWAKRPFSLKHKRICHFYDTKLLWLSVSYRSANYIF